MWDGPPEPPVRREVIELLRRLDPFRSYPDPIGALLPKLSSRERHLLASATQAELQMAALEALYDAARVEHLVEMEDGTMAPLPDDPDWA